MRLKIIVTAVAVAGAMAMLAAPADAASKKKHVVTTAARGAVFVSRDEDGRTRTGIIIQKRSYLDPGTETFPGENLGNNNYVQSPNHRADDVLDNTAFGSNQTALPGPWTLPGKNNPWLKY
jgi:hypothetical protein